MTNRVTMDDVRAAGYCASGVRTWFADKGLDLRAFVRDGISEDDFLALKDAHADAVVRLKRQKEGRTSG